MTFLSAALAVVLSQADVTVTTPVAVPAVVVEMSPADKAAASAERAALAAEKAALAVQKMAEAMNPTPAPAAAAAAADAAEAWKGTFGVGLAFITGNTQSLTATVNASADRKFGAWAVGIRLGGAYGFTPAEILLGVATPPPAGKENLGVTARRANVTVRGDRSFGDIVSIFALAGAEFDHVKSIESRSFGEVGTGLTVLNKMDADIERLYLRFDLAARFGYETRHNFVPTLSKVDPYGIVILAPRAAVTFRTTFGKDVKFSEQLEFIPYLLAPTSGRLLINSTTKINAKLTETVSLSLSLLLNFDGTPPKKELVPLDAALTAGVEAAF
jgi:hypothetical protein